MILAPKVEDKSSIPPWFWVALLMIVAVVATLTPPFQVPDEYNHVARAEMLGRGQLFLNSNDGQPSGGMVDTALFEYMDRFRGVGAKQEVKLSTTQLAAAGLIRWSGIEARYAAPNLAYYFPAIYAPQAAGLWLGRQLNASVATSYGVARAIALSACVAILAQAFSLWKPPALTLVIVALPMSVFLLASAAIDGLANALTVLLLSLFWRLRSDGRSARRLHWWFFFASLMLVASSRPHALPLLALPLLLYRNRADRWVLGIGVAVAVCVVGWTVVTVKTTVYGSEGILAVDHLSKLLHYLRYPQTFFSVLQDTVSDTDRIRFYKNSFIGVLGWLDTWLTRPAYHRFGALLLIALVVTLMSSRGEWRIRLSILGLALGSSLLIFLALLVQWNPVGATVIEGVQGRYFILPALILGYAFAPLGQRPTSPWMHRTVMVLALVTLLMTATSTTSAMVVRYYTHVL